MLENVTLFCHSSIKLTGTKTIYIDPYMIEDEYKDADYIFCTHGHYDHFSEEDIIKVMNENTKIITVEGTHGMAKELFRDESKIMIVEPQNEYQIDDINFKTTVAYNKEKMYHQKKEKWVGYIIELDGLNYYIAGDTDALDELLSIECDVAFLPVGGKYTMDYKEAAMLANEITADIVIPTHYGSIVGEKSDGENFKKLVEDKDVCVILN